MSSIGSRRLTQALWILAGLACARLAFVSVRAIGEPSNGFVAYYTPARLLVEGAEAERFYDDDWFREQVTRFEPSVSDIYNINPPTMATLLLPLAWADYRTARGIWIGGSFLLLLSVIAWLVRRLGLSGPWAPAFVSIALLSGPARDNLVHGQAYVLVLALLTMAWYGYRAPTREFVLGTSLGLAGATKTAALTLWPLLAVQRRWRALVWGVGSALALVLASLPIIGIAAWRRYIPLAIALSGDARLGNTSYQTSLGFWLQIAGPGVGNHAALACALLLLGISLVAAYRADASDMIFAAFVTLWLIVSPVSSEPHYTMALLPLALLMSELKGRDSPPCGTALLLIAAFLLSANLPYLSTPVRGAAALLAYPRLLAALLLWALALAWTRKRPEQSAPGAAST